MAKTRDYTNELQSAYSMGRGSPVQPYQGQFGATTATDTMRRVEGIGADFRRAREGVPGAPLPTNQASAAAAGQGAYNAGRAVQDVRGTMDNGQSRRMLDQANPYDPPTTAPAPVMSQKNQELSRQLDASTSDYTSKLERPKMDKKIRKLSADLDAASNDYISRLDSLYSSGRRG